MKLLVILEQHFFKDSEHVYVDVQSDSNYWNRYLQVFDEIIVCARMSELSSDQIKKQLLISDRENVSFCGLPDFKGFAGALKNIVKVNRIASELIKRSDCFIMRAPSPITTILYPSIMRSRKPFAIEMMMNPLTAYSKESINSPLQPLIQKMATDVTKNMCMKANGVSYVTEHTLQKDYPCKGLLSQISDTYFTASYSTISLNKSDIKKRQWPKEAPKPLILVHTGKMADNRKGHKEFIRIIKRIKDLDIDVRGILIGDGDQKNELLNLSKELNVEKMIRFTGWKAGFKEVQEELQKGHIFVYPTKSEGLPRSVIEAMASGLVCVCSSVDGIPELIDSNYLCDENSVEQFVHKILSIYNNWEKVDEIRDRNIEKAKQYTSDILKLKRTAFYSALYKVAEERNKKDDKKISKLY